MNLKANPTCVAKAPQHARGRGRPRALAALFAALLAWHAPAAKATTEFCANSDGGLQTAFVVASLSGDSYRIKLVQDALKPVPGKYQLTTLTSYGVSNPTLSVEGGYTAGCAGRSVAASNTTIDFAGTAVFIYSVIGIDDQQIAFDGLTLAHGSTLFLGAGYRNEAPLGQSYTGNISLSNTRITDFSAATGPPLDLATQTSSRQPLDIEVDQGGIALENVQIDHVRQSGVSPCALYFQLDHGTTMTLNFVSIDLANAKNFCLGPGYSSGGQNDVYIYNSIVWPSDGTLASIQGLDVWENQGPLNLVLVNDLFKSAFGYGSRSVTSQLNQDPKWMSPNPEGSYLSADYRLDVSVPPSPAANSGTPVDLLGVPSTDIAGAHRPVGTRPDRGAYESALDDSSVFTVSKVADTNDGVCDADCSLREAITAANSSPNPATIRFQIPGACPRTILLSSTLPKIVSPTIIDGTTQAGSSPNTAGFGSGQDVGPLGSNATLCVVIKPASGALVYVFDVPATAASTTSLTVRGFAMGGFSEPIVLLGGTDHVIAGNQIGGLVAGIDLPGPAFSGVTIGVNAGGKLTVGGLASADRNVLGGASFDGVSVQSGVASSTADCQIVGNLIGTTPSGNSPVSNGWGVGLAGSGCLVSKNRIVGNTADAVLINGGNNNVVQGNTLGLFVNGTGALNNGAGVSITSGNGNAIGFSSTNSVGSPLLGNVISAMVAGGVVDKSAAGQNNSIRGNRIYDNGATGIGMDIDLAPGAATGPTPNDLDDADTGPNELENFPLVTGLQLAGNDAILTGSLNSVAGTHRIDVYFSNGCNSNGRGHAERYLATTSVTIGAGAHDATFSLPITVPNTQPDAQLSLTATRDGAGTSELGTCFAAAASDIFKSSYE